MDWQSIAIKAAIGVITALLTGLGSWLLVKVKTLISTKIKDAKLVELLTSATDIVASAVKATYQTYVEGIKGTERWTIEAQKSALQNALNIAKAQMSDAVKKELTKRYGDLDVWLMTKIESTLYELKK